MTPEERTDKILANICSCTCHKRDESVCDQCCPWDGALARLIAAEIRAAVEEQKDRCAIDHTVNTEKAKAEAYEDAIQWVRARARDCGCSEWIEDNIRARVKELKGEEV